MTDYIVLVKQVPDVTQITDNAFDPETGNLIRTRLPSVINELDAQAFAFACKMRAVSGDTAGRIICLTMGPPMAQAVLYYGLARCADSAVLLTDRTLGGADTWATANPLAYAVRKIVREMLDGTNDYFIVAGMQSVDGDTAQVPAQIAQELSLPCIAYATDAEYVNGSFIFRTIISGGSQMVSPRSLPAVITVAKHEYPLFAGFASTRRAVRLKVTQWGADDIKAQATGIKGSKTRVIRVFPPGKTNRKCLQLHSAKELAGIIARSAKDTQQNQKASTDYKPYVLPEQRTDRFDRSYEGTAKEIEDYKILADKLTELAVKDISQIDEKTTEAILSSCGERFHKKTLEDMFAGLQKTKPDYHGDVWVIAEQTPDGIHPATFELTGKARELADSLNVRVGVVLAGQSVKQKADALIAAGADDVYVIEDPLLARFDPSAHCGAVADVVGKYWPQIVLFAATPQGRVLAPMVSYKLGCGLTADCTGLDIRDSSRKGQTGILMQTRPALGGNVMATICTKDSKCQMATARPGVMKRLTPDPARKGSVIIHKVALAEKDVSLNIISTEMGAGKVAFDADVIVTGGKGMQSRDNYERLTGMLCQVLGECLNAKVERGASRAAVEQGFIDRIHQVGQTGTAVGPNLYVALGVSGAIQHMIGVSNSRTIVAINSDPHAPVFRQCDYYIVGTVEQIIPQLAEELKAV